MSLNLVVNSIYEQLLNCFKLLSKAEFIELNTNPRRTSWKNERNKQFLKRLLPETQKLYIETDLSRPQNFK